MSYHYVSGFVPFISALKRNNVKTAIVTSSNLDKMKNVYRVYLEILDCFDAILTSENFGQSKPNPECYIKGAEMVNVSPF